MAVKESKFDNRLSRNRPVHRMNSQRTLLLCQYTEENNKIRKLLLLEHETQEGTLS